MPPQNVFYRESIDAHIATLLRLIQMQKLHYAIISPQARARWHRFHTRSPYPRATPWENLEHLADQLYATREFYPSRKEMQRGAQAYRYDPRSQSYTSYY